MGVYVGQAMWPFKGKMYSHMIADTHKELEIMAWKIGMERRWIQKESELDEHYDIGPRKRDAAIKRGAIEVTDREIVRMLRARREEGGTSYYGQARTKTKTQ